MLLRKCGESGRGIRALTERGRRHRRREDAARLTLWPAAAQGDLPPDVPADTLSASQAVSELPVREVTHLPNRVPSREPSRLPGRPPELLPVGSGASFEGVAWLWQVLGSSQAAREQWAELLRLAATSAETPVRAETLNLVGRFASTAGDVTTAHHFFQEALIAGRAGQNAASVAGSLCGLARVSVERGAFDLARTLQEEALGLQRRLGETRAAAGSLAVLGWLTLEVRGLRQAEALQEEALTLRVTLGDSLLLSYSLVHLGWLAHLTDRPDMARRHLAEALTTVRGCPDRWKVVALLSLLGRPSPTETPLQHAIRLLTGVEVQEGVSPPAEAHASDARERLIPRTLAMAWGGGGQMDAAGVVEQALQAAEAHAQRQHAALTEPPERMLLTPRELEVASLIGRGHTNRRIAEVLVIAERTAETHARNIREKLGLSSRAQIAAWVAARGLLGDVSRGDRHDT